GQAKLLSPPTPELIPDLPASPLATPMSTSMSGPQRTSRRPMINTRMPRSPYALTHSDVDSDALFAFDMPSDDPIFLPNASHIAGRRQSSNASRARPYPACRAYASPTAAHHPTADFKSSTGPPPLGYFPPAPEPSPALDMFTNPGSHGAGWDHHPHHSKSYPTPGHSNNNNNHQHYPTYASSPPPPSYGFQTQAQTQTQTQFPPTPQQPSFGGGGNPASPPHTELDMHHHLGDDADRARMSALMYGSMRVRAVVAASEADGAQGW
ncbi:hypothetical protein FRC12_010357, partial [Ceratobasidium sp. 428]